MSVAPSAKGVFINCPYDENYKPFFHASIFAVRRCGFEARSAAEVKGSVENRLNKIQRIIEDCPLAIHDISRTELHPEHGLPRFNMPFELGLFLGAQAFGNPAQRKKDCIVLDSDLKRYDDFLSDIRGQDIAAHGNDPRLLVGEVRAFLNTHSGAVPLPDGEIIWEEYEVFLTELPAICEELKLKPENLEFRDFAYIVSDYVSEDDLPAQKAGN